LTSWLNQGTFWSALPRNLARDIHGLFDQRQDVIIILGLTHKQNATHRANELLVNPHVSLAPTLNYICPKNSRLQYCLPPVLSFLFIIQSTS
jgi:hypothetical protein